MMTRKDIQREARQIVGAEWVHQGRDPGSGIDCIGVIVWVANKVGLDFPDRTNYSREPVGNLLVEEIRERLDEIPINEAREGDILVLRGAGKPLPTHVAILARGESEYTLIHSIQLSSARKTVEEPYRRWKRLVTNAFKFRQLVETDD